IPHYSKYPVNDLVTNSINYRHLILSLGYLPPEIILEVPLKRGTANCRHVEKCLHFLIGHMAYPAFASYAGSGFMVIRNNSAITGKLLWIIKKCKFISPDNGIHRYDHS